jgi:hypothetical protein
MTASDVQAGTWAPVGPPFSSYEATHGIPGVERARVRSVDRIDSIGRRRQGAELTQSRDSRAAPRVGYWRVNVTDDDGRKRPGTYVHTLVMLAYEGPCPPGKQVRHFDDDPDHNWWVPGGEAAILAGGAGGLIYGDPKDQWRDKVRNRPQPDLVEQFADPALTGSDYGPAWQRSRRVARNVVSRIRRWFV